MCACVHPHVCMFVSWQPKHVTSVCACDAWCAHACGQDGIFDMPSFAWLVRCMLRIFVSWQAEHVPTYSWVDRRSPFDMVASYARFTTFQRGRIVGLAEAGATRNQIRNKVRKKDVNRGGTRATTFIKWLAAQSRAVVHSIICGLVCGWLVCG